TGDVKLFELKLLLEELVYGATVEDIFTIYNNYKEHSETDSRKILTALWEALELKPGLFGFKFDIKSFLNAKEILKRLKENKLN
ncbi:MAG TPA: hypothetical protein VGB00_17555, partial [Pyrinomonadaceae bacterium]